MNPDWVGLWAPGMPSRHPVAMATNPINQLLYKEETKQLVHINVPTLDGTKSVLRIYQFNSI